MYMKHHKPLHLIASIFLLCGTFETLPFFIYTQVNIALGTYQSCFMPYVEIEFCSFGGANNTVIAVLASLLSGA